MRIVSKDAFGNAIGNSVVDKLNTRQTVTPEEQARLDAFGRSISQDASDKVNGQLNERIVNINENIANSVGTDAASIAQSLVRTQTVSTKVRDVSRLAQLSADYNADIRAKTAQSQQTSYRVNQLVAETNQLLGNNIEVGLQGVQGSDGIYGVPELLARPDSGIVGVPSLLARFGSNQGVGPWADGYTFPQESSLLNGVSTASDWISSIAQSGKIANEFVGRNKIINTLSSRDRKSVV